MNKLAMVVLLSLSQLKAEQLFLARAEQVQYPPLALQARISGRVELELQIRPDGTVESVKVLKGHPVLGEGASKELQKWRFAACQSNPISKSQTRLRMVVEFVLEGVARERPTSKMIYTFPDRITVVGEPLHWQP